MNNSVSKYIAIMTIVIMLFSCVKNREFDTPELACSDSEFSFISISELKSLYNGETMQIHEDLFVKGYVISSDKEGNFFNTVHFQDESSNPSDGMQIELELRDSHLFFDVGQQIIIKLKGLYLSKSNDVYKIGGVFTSFGNRSVGRLPKNVVFDHVWMSCELNSGIEPTLGVISELNDSMLNTLITLNNVEIKQEELGETFAVKEEETLRTLVDCLDNELVMVNSGYADFQSEILPDKMGTAIGLLTKDNNQYQLILSSKNDLVFTQERCKNLIDEFTSSSILISEIADPDNNAGARFVELYNTSEETLSLKGWKLKRYTNDNIEVSSSIDLSNYEIPGKGFLIISPNAEEFKNIYGFDSNISVGTNSPADSNGDDTIVLVDPFNSVVDIFGVIGEDGSNTNHEFEDGRAVRKIEINSNNTVFDPAEWLIYNDTGGEGTINQPQNAPLDFTPGFR
ncbi:DUF5689 domain-containing protein [Maribacter sp. SA7]|uniref:DUF5689 domain-containing protein n=1 Tax=Maribacter zhoushanensis TaxID=3030012 RepID=UPI0023EDD130|nr:DUF5689 domain-containing protein [Maribacter zhoushanensis]MDF4203507.1 DUF5689 domain-containing protein [Maribacter zhoushanensis]